MCRWSVWILKKKTRRSYELITLNRNQRLELPETKIHSQKFTEKYKREYNKKKSYSKNLK